MRFWLNAALVVLCTTSALADIPPPPPPKGKKYVDVAATVAVAKDVSGYKYVMIVSRGPGRPQLEYSVVALSDKPTAVPAGGRRTFVRLVAVPEAEAKKHATEKDLAAAMEKSGIPAGSHEMYFQSGDVIEESFKDKAVKWDYTITAIDAKKGITKTILRDGKPFDEKAGKVDNADEDLPSSAGMPVRWVVGGLLGAVGILALGVWIMKR